MPRDIWQKNQPSHFDIFLSFNIKCPPISKMKKKNDNNFSWNRHIMLDILKTSILIK